jgi:hypothetical protein
MNITLLILLRSQGSLDRSGEPMALPRIRDEADLRRYDNFGLFCARLASTGVADTLRDLDPSLRLQPAIEAHEAKVGPVNAEVLKYCIVAGKVAASGVSSADLTTLQGKPLTYTRKFRKDFVDDAILGENTFGPFANYPIDVACDNGVIHTIGIALSPDYAAVGGGVGNGFK